MTYWINSQLNYDMISQHPQDTMNLHMNQLMQHSVAMDSIYAVPQYSFENFIPYANFNNNNFLLNPMYTLAQMTWGTPSWNNVNWNTNPWSNFGWNGPVQNNGGGDSGDKDSTPGMKEKYNKLLSILKQFEKYEDNGLSSSERADLNSVIRDVSGNYDEKYERLEKAYKKYCDKDIMKEFLPTAIALGVNDDIKGNSKDKNSFYNRLLATGFEYEDKTIDEHLDNIYREIEDLTDATANGVSAEGIIASIGLGTYDILDVISSWNSKYKENGEDRPNNIIDKITESYNDMDDSDMKEDVKTGLIKPLIDELIKKADKIKVSLDNNSKEKINETIDNLRYAYSEISNDGIIGTSLSEEFNKLYLYTRQGAMAKFAVDANKYYGEIDSDLFNTQLLVKEMKSDLTKEGFSSDDINDTKVNLSAKELRGSTESEDVADEEEADGRIVNDENDGKVDESKNNDSQSNNENRTSNTEIYNSGKEVYKLLNRWTDKDDKYSIKKYVDIVNKNNILDFLHGYYKVGSSDNEGLIEALFDDAEYSTKECLEIVKLLLDKAKEVPGIKDSNEYDLLKRTYKECEDKLKANPDFDLDNSADDYILDWALWCIGCDYDYKEKLDDQMKKLYIKVMTELGA